MKINLEEQWLIEMALPRKDAIEICKRYTLAFIVHVAKCFLFSSSEAYDHWLTGAANFCIKCDDLSVKPDGRRLSPEVFLSDECICEEIETARDARHYLDLAITYCDEIREELATPEEGFIFLDLWEDLRYTLADYLSDSDAFDRNTYKELIDRVIKEHKSDSIR